MSPVDVDKFVFFFLFLSFFKIDTADYQHHISSSGSRRMSWSSSLVVKRYCLVSQCSYDKLPQTQWLKNTNIFSCNSGAQKCKIGLTVPKSRCYKLGGCISPRGLGGGGDCLLAFFLASRGCLHFLASGPFQQQPVVFLTPQYHRFVSLMLTLLPPCFTYKDLCDYNVPTQIIQDNYHISRS